MEVEVEHSRPFETRQDCKMSAAAFFGGKAKAGAGAAAGDAGGKKKAALQPWVEK
jgi:hypothetical protein